MLDNLNTQTTRKPINIKIESKKLFQNIEYLIQKGKGYSVFNASNDVFENLAVEFQKTTKNLCKVVKVSSFNGDEIEKGIPIIVYQDLSFIKLLEKADELVNKLIYPAWHKGCSLFFISKIDKSHYNVSEIQSSLIHTDYKRVLSLLSIEQMNNLLDMVNVVISSPELINDFDDNVQYTPIEKIFKDKLIENNISYDPQVKLGRFYVDFLVTVNNSKVIVECDGREYHNSYRDHERDKEIKKEGYKIHRFSGSMLFNDCDRCLNEIIRYSNSDSNPKYVLEELNDEQILAINHITAPMRVLAPAGSGKTKTLVNRIVNLVNNGIQESEILALAFNTKAKNEMSKRLNEKYGLSSVAIKTFHSFGNGIIKDTLKWRFNGDNQEKVTRDLLEKVVKRHGKIAYQRNKDSMDEYLSMLSKAKNDLLPISEMVMPENRSIDFGLIFNDYIAKAFEHNFYNYDDMLYIAVRQLLSDSILRRKVQNQYNYILVDEFQDLNKVQLLLLQILALPKNNIFIVGDDDQMIYGFRGAEIKHILEFDKRYAITTDQVLKINYRSCSNIVRHSKWLIDHNKLRVPKDITPFSEERGEISLYIGDSLADQAEKVAQWILEHKNENTKWSDFAILHRYNQYSDILYITLSKLNIPVQFDRIKVLNTSVGRCILSYLTIIYDNGNAKAEHYAEVLKKPNRYFTNEFINTIKSWDDFVNIERARNSLRQMDIDKYINLVNKINSISSIAEDKPACNIISTIVEEFGLRQFYKDQSKLSSDIDAASDYDILEIIMAFSESFNGIGEFYNYWINLSHEKDKVVENDSDEKANDKVLLSSIHKAKGNEFKNVAYYNLVSSVTSKATETELEEERRVSYVGVTRPKKSLIMTSQKGEISPFIKEFFLNPKYYGMRQEELQAQISNLEAEVNTIKVSLHQIDDQINELTTKYPELKGEYAKTTGWFKVVKQYMRQVSVNSALVKHKEYNEKKKKIEKENYPLLNERIDLESELEYRQTIEQGESLPTDSERSKLLDERAASIRLRLIEAKKNEGNKEEEKHEEDYDDFYRDVIEEAHKEAHSAALYDQAYSDDCIVNKHENTAKINTEMISRKPEALERSVIRELLRNGSLSRGSLYGYGNHSPKNSIENVCWKAHIPDSKTIAYGWLCNGSNNGSIEINLIACMDEATFKILGDVLDGMEEYSRKLNCSVIVARIFPSNNANEDSIKTESIEILHQKGYQSSNEWVYDRNHSGVLTYEKTMVMCS